MLKKVILIGALALSGCVETSNVEKKRTGEVIALACKVSSRYAAIKSYDVYYRMGSRTVILSSDRGHAPLTVSFVVKDSDGGDIIGGFIYTGKIGVDVYDMHRIDYITAQRYPRGTSFAMVYGPDVYGMSFHIINANGDVERQVRVDLCTKVA